VLKGILRNDGITNAITCPQLDGDRQSTISPLQYKTMPKNFIGNWFY